MTGAERLRAMDEWLETAEDDVRRLLEEGHASHGHNAMRFIRKARAALEAQAQRGWRPMETAQSGWRVLLDTKQRGVVTGYYSASAKRWTTDGPNGGWTVTPTGWLPLPPSEDEQGERALWEATLSDGLEAQAQPADTVLADICRLAGIPASAVEAGWPGSVEAALEPLVRGAIGAGAWPVTQAQPAEDRSTPREGLVERCEECESADVQRVSLLVCNACAHETDAPFQPAEDRSTPREGLDVIWDALLAANRMGNVLYNLPHRVQADGTVLLTGKDADDITRTRREWDTAEREALTAVRAMRSALRTPAEAQQGETRQFWTGARCGCGGTITVSCDFCGDDPALAPEPAAEETP